MNVIFAIMITAGIAVFAAKGDGAGALDALTRGCGGAVTLTLELSGTYMLWMGLMNVAKEAGLVDKLARAMRKPLGRLMPGAGDAIAPVTLNLAANFFGLGNAATPFGVAAMKALDDGTGRASNDMVTFIALNASAIELLPTTVIAVRSACGSSDPWSVAVPAFIASVAAAAAAVLACRLLEKITK